MGKIVKLLAKYYPVYLSGLWGTLWISAVTVLLGLVLGMLVALMRMSRSKLLNAVSGVYIEVLRGTPILLQLYFFWIGLPKLVPFELSPIRSASSWRWRSTLPRLSRRSSARASPPSIRASGRPRGASAFPKRMS